MDPTDAKKRRGNLRNDGKEEEKTKEKKKREWGKGRDEHKIELTEVTPFILNLEGPDTDWVFAPIVDGHEGPRVEAVAGGIVRSECQQG